MTNKSKIHIFLGWPLGRFFLDFQLGLLEFGLSPLVLYFLCANEVVGTLIELILNLSNRDSLCKNKPPNIGIIAETNKRRVKNPSDGFFNSCKINMHGLENSAI